MENGLVEPLDSEDARRNDGRQEDRGTRTNHPTKLHKRNLSASLLSKLSFLSPASGNDGTEDEPSAIHASTREKPAAGAMSGVMSPKASRRRKDSLRKTAILGTGKRRADGRDRSTGPMATESSPNGETGPDQVENGQSRPAKLLHTRDTRDAQETTTAEARRSRALEFRSNGDSQPESLLSPITSPTSGTGEASTTDEEDVLMLHHPSHSHSHPTPLLGGNLQSHRKLPSSGSEGGGSYFPLRAVTPPPRRRGGTLKAGGHSKSPLSALPSAETTGLAGLSAVEAEWDYTETAGWGWVVLTVTWLVFVVGMGSCLDVWSWAWDVGETPYAPPELEDDATLPIVGYYPALMILTGVMAWVWVVVAWVGMKYFKHAKIQSEDD